MFHHCKQKLNFDYSECFRWLGIAQFLIDQILRNHSWCYFTETVNLTSFLTVFKAQSRVPVNIGFCPGSGWGIVWRRTWQQYFYYLLHYYNKDKNVKITTVRVKVLYKIYKKLHNTNTSWIIFVHFPNSWNVWWSDLCNLAWQHKGSISCKKLRSNISFIAYFYNISNRL